MDRMKAYRHFHALLGELGLRDRKADLLAGYGSESAAALSDRQLMQLIGALEEERRRRTGTASRTEADTLRRHRSRVLRLLSDTGVYHVEPGEPHDACWRRVNAFVSSPRIAGKVFYALSVEELRALETKLRAMRDKGYFYRPPARPAYPPPPVVVIVNPDADGPVN